MLCRMREGGEHLAHPRRALGAGDPAFKCRRRSLALLRRASPERFVISLALSSSNTMFHLVPSDARVAGSTKGHLGYTSIYVLARQRVNATHGINNPAPSVRCLVRGVGLATGTARYIERWLRRIVVASVSVGGRCDNVGDNSDVNVQ